ncbi:hypothetical protein [Thauera aminoaromatica]|uniref:Uncharacterized protein n=1 Tax=Thauera aminoaromatica TaxID=164330 RepID=A0A5C7SWL5_THASP|nr:hypothetical protein [Thauera aminoaromatica]TXH87061.1 MAG: hypothetical protein E6Q80_06665 [Thauera aminoaromatica]
MLATFEGRVENGQLTIPELGKALKVLEGKRVAITSLKANRNGELAGGQLIAGVWKKGTLEPVEGARLDSFNGLDVYVVVRHEFFVKSQAFDQKFQLGSKVGDIDK